MCGIAVVSDDGPGAPALFDTLEAMHRDLASRGPDGEGWLVVDQEFRPHRLQTSPLAARAPIERPRLAAAFRRLAIRDTGTAANQPIAARNGAVWVFHNGEIYNDADLRAELGAGGARFSTGSDAETVAAAYEAWGDACFERLRGMWACVIVDLTRRRLVLSRDRLGIKPLFHAVQGTRLVVASHARTVARAFGPRIDASRWHRFLRGLPAGHADGAFFEGVQAVPSGSILTIDLTRPGLQAPHARRYWTLSACVADPRDGRTPAAIKDELAGLLDSSTRDHLIADREVGCLLSGGLDSSIVACLASRELKRHAGTLTCYSIVYDDPRMSEWPFIQSVAAHAGCRSVTHRLTPAEAFGLVDAVVAAQGEPLLGQDTIAHYRVFGLAREHGCVVSLEGQAADELFAGMPLYEGVMFREWLTSGAWGRFYREGQLRAAAQQRPLSAILREYTFGAAGRRWTTRANRHAWLSTPSVNGTARPATALPPEQSADASRLNRYLFDLVRHTNLPVVLQIQDRNAMAHGVENRPPYLDHRLVEWAFRLPAGAKVGDGRRKRVLWDVARDIVPPLVLARTNKRAIVSRGDWMPLRTAHRTELEAMAGSTSLRQAPYIDGNRMTRFVHDYLAAAHDDAASVWRLYTAWRWLEQFRPAA